MSETVDPARQDLLRTVAAGTAGVVGEEFLQRLVQAVGETFGGGVCWISELSDSGQSARSLASWPPEREGALIASRANVLRRPTRSAGGSGATSTTAPSSG
jgi:hypothetical protein